MPFTRPYSDETGAVVVKVKIAAIAIKEETRCGTGGQVDMAI